MGNIVYVLDVPENTSIVETAGNSADVKIGKVGSYFVIEADQPIVVDRRATGVRHAVWYSWVSALSGCRITQWDKDALRADPR
ncbi:hypothetical protein [Mycobacterium vicinigordonae]|uniref:Uncharacterized protein n=1 Tax=Mycobacterium vicinigordonae TaxID=1719132 RepID=A0A7D6HS91_9MYCO|nr:hypothetical protein [Mycobacterium vicinigordonae]QLL06152.1 hypothetical protein H0P51_20605 [Mycobacterium vicinigordonae]